MRHYRVLFVIGLIILSSCNTMRMNVPYVNYIDNDLLEIIGPKTEYCVYDFISPQTATADKDIFRPAHYHILLPKKKYMRNMFISDFDRIFLYSNGRGIAIFQVLSKSDGRNNNGLQEISTETVEHYIMDCFIWPTKYNENSYPPIKQRKKHYLYVDNEIMIIIFNISENDYDSFVNLPVTSLKVTRRGEYLIGNQSQQSK